MKKSPKFILFVILLNSIWCTAQNDTILKLFRTTHVGKDGKVSLQANIETIKDIAVKDAGNNYHLRRGSFGIADSIWIEVNNLKQIIGVAFLYNYDTAIVHETQYVHELKKYQKLIESLGKEYKYSTNTKSITITKWEDKSTRFELIEIVEQGKRTTYSVIFDNELYFKKMKGSINLNKHDNSIELLKIIGVKQKY